MLVARSTLLKQALAGCDAATLAASFAGSYWFVDRVFQRHFISFGNYAWLFLLIVPLWLFSLWLFGFYGTPAYGSPRVILGGLVRVQLFSGLALLSAMYITRSEGVSRLLLHCFLAASFAALLAQKFLIKAYLERKGRRPARDRRKILIATPTAAAGARYAEMTRAHASFQADVIGLITSAASQLDDQAEPAAQVIGRIDDLPAVLQTQVIDEVVAASTLDSPLIERLGRSCLIRGIPMSIFVEAPKPPIGVWDVEHIGDAGFLLSVATTPQKPLHLALKRLVDIVGGLAGLICCGLAYLWYATRLRRETGGTALFQQSRIGTNGRRFTLYKFRTMCANAEQIALALNRENQMSGPIFKIKDDPRVTPTGRSLRRCHLDELPQFWNILRGEMSLVGTRPPTEDEVAAYADHHHRRLSMKPGLTGLWQLAGNATVKDFDEVVKLDCEYIDKWSLWLDLKILGRTIAKVLRGDAW